MVHVIQPSVRELFMLRTSPEAEAIPTEQVSTHAINSIFTDFAYWQDVSKTTLEHAQTLRQQEVPFSDKLAACIADTLTLQTDSVTALAQEDTSKLTASRRVMFEASVLAMGYGGLLVEPKLVEAGANRAGSTMESVRLALVPSDWKLLDIANMKRRELSDEEQMEYRSNVRRTLIRCGGAPRFNNFMIRYYQLDLPELAKSSLTMLARGLRLSS